MRFGFVTCVQLGLACMEEIYSVGGNFDLVITLKDENSRNKSGRIYADEFCRRHDIDLLKVDSVNDAQAVDAIRYHNLDWLFIIGWSQIASPPVLRAPHRGVLGMHPTLLPVGRGRAAIPWAILKDLPETGVTLFQLDEGVDTGPIVAQERIALGPDETATKLYDRVAEAHRTLIKRVWWDLGNDRLNPVPQDESKATIWRGRTSEDGRILPEMSVEYVEKLVRSTTRPYPGAFWQDGERVVRVWAGMAGTVGAANNLGTTVILLRDGVFFALDFDVENIGLNRR